MMIAPMTHHDPQAIGIPISQAFLDIEFFSLG
jgi:hypothetical protein